MASGNPDMELDEATINTLCNVIYSSQIQLLDGNPVDGVEILHGGVFALPCAPGLVFKISNDPKGSDLLSRWSNVQRVAEILKTPQFNLLALPRQILIGLQIGEEEYCVIVEQRLRLTNNFLVHKGLYESLGAHLEPALRQLVAFIITSGFCGVDFRHVPILNEELPYELAPGNIPNIGLVDVSDCGDVPGEAAQQIYHEAFFGKGPTMRGLFRCIAPEQSELVREISKHRVTLDLPAYYEAWKDRCHDLEEAHRNLRLVNAEDAYEGRAKSIFKTVAKFLFVAIPPTLRVITDPLDAFDEEQQLFMAPRRFKVGPFHQSDLILRGVMVLDPKTRSLAALSMSIQGNIASSLADTTSLRKRLDQICCTKLMNLEHTPEKSKTKLEKLPVK
ncbi:hypothetical protein T069G_01821 [Trichoderma breve]|uniref:Uncharacterized protein n=1 Tax=Trichoderma breve TaxID=2034170 RepID=A0A9W9JSG9_9HYPO|nr:hypothetical protein T069G_01821 [Trichoderma breve]KAJ4865291.1 hypothetical protein T069G_01821 [Trichoderma breve]